MQPCRATRPTMGPRRALSAAAFLAGESVATSLVGGPRDQASVLVYPLRTHSGMMSVVMESEHREGKGGEGEEREGQRTWTRSPRSSVENDARTFWRTSPSPALSTPAILGANQVSQTRQRSMLKWIRARPTMKGRKLSTPPYSLHW